MNDPNLEKTLEMLRQALAVSPANGPLLRHYAASLESADRLDEARQQWGAALEVDPRDAEALLGLARLLGRQNRGEEAAARLADLLRLDDKNALAHLEMARVLLGLGRRDKAGKHYQMAADLDPTLLDSALEKQLFPPQESEKPRVARSYGPQDDEDDPFDDADPLSALGLQMEKPDLDFSGVGGMENLKEDIRLNIIYPFQHPEVYAAYGKKIGGGILLYGPPGCGKTFIARATAGQCGARFIAVGIEDVLDMWHGQSERKLHLIFEAARRAAPTVIFFDELDALAGKRSDMSHSPHARTIVNQFLSELDGVKGQNENLLIMGATNSPWHIDPAFRRPGRFDKIIFVPPPDAPARAEILALHCAGKPCDKLDFAKIAARMKRFSGADIAATTEMAAETALRETLKTGQMRSITEKDFAAALKQIKPTTDEWLATARNYSLYANQTGTYDAVAEYLG
ncbi:MAG: AAA family ATPase, partial [Armatimonadetes bacterium]|nr:AAA family ATPase [Armatimonadota bacterium]